MKKALYLFAGLMFVLAFGIAYGDELQPMNEYTSDKMIRNEDLSKYDRYDQDQGSGTYNQLPALPDDVRGSAAGGVSEETGPALKSNTDANVPVDKDTIKPADRGEDTGSPSRSREPYRY